jgi:hypothetical protein
MRILFSKALTGNLIFSLYYPVLDRSQMVYAKIYYIYDNMRVSTLTGDDQRR